MKGEEEVAGMVAIGLVVMVCLVEGEENVAVLVDRDLVELVALIRLYPAKSTEAEVLEVEA